MSPCSILALPALGLLTSGAALLGPAAPWWKSMGSATAVRRYVSMRVDSGARAGRSAGGAPGCQSVTDPAGHVGFCGIQQGQLCVHICLQPSLLSLIFGGDRDTCLRMGCFRHHVSYALRVPQRRGHITEVEVGVCGALHRTGNHRQHFVVFQTSTELYVHQAVKFPLQGVER